MNEQQKQQYNEEEVREVVKHYDLEHQTRMTYILDHYYYDFSVGCWKKKQK